MGINDRWILSVDWDWFVPEDPIWDAGHRESTLFLKFVWFTRATLMEVWKTSGQEDSFWERMREIVDLDKCTKIDVSDSHSSCFHLVDRHDRLILVDAHHDCLPWDENPHRIDCANWVRVWLRMGRYKRNPLHMFWVKPKWQKNLTLKGVPKKIREQITVTRLEKLREALGCKPKIDTIHVCRSGCWTPPWLDKKFQEFLRSSQKEISVTEPKPWDGWEERWNETDLQQARNMAATFAAHQRSGR